nr:unnamed protein product [Callosobruchus analis]
MNSLFIWTFSDFLLQFPKSEAEWIQIGSDFNERWQFPNCLGAVDGKHIRIRPPSGSGAYYYNYKQFHSIALMGIANSNYEFIMFDVGTNGRVSDGDVINNTCFYKALVEGQLKIPAVNERNNLPYVFIGDEAFALRKDFLKPYNEREPNPKEIWKKSAKGFYDVWKFPNCIGSIDGKHITIKCPKNTGSTHFCYLKKFSIVLMAIVGPEFTFLCVDIGGYGKNSDGGIFEESNMGRRFAAGLMNVPPDRNLPGTNINVPHVLIGDEAFALKPTLMRPYPYRQSRGNKRKEEYNTRLCTARRVVENAFGILAQKWRIFHRPIETSVDTTIKIVRSTCILHNFIRTKNCDSLYFEYLDPVESTMDAFANLERDPRRATNMAFDIREKFADFFNK